MEKSRNAVRCCLDKQQELFKKFSVKQCSQHPVGGNNAPFYVGLPNRGRRLAGKADEGLTLL